MSAEWRAESGERWLESGKLTIRWSFGREGIPKTAEIKNIGI